MKKAKKVSSRKSEAHIAKAWRDRAKEAGLKKKEIWVWPEDEVSVDALQSRGDVRVVGGEVVVNKTIKSS